MLHLRRDETSFPPPLPLAKFRHRVKNDFANAGPKVARRQAREAGGRQAPGTTPENGRVNNKEETRMKFFKKNGKPIWISLM